MVEYKTNRRQVPARPPSIWGNLDLQAVARQIEADGILLDVARQDPHVTISGKAPIAAIAPSQHSQAPVENHTLTSSELTVAMTTVYSMKSCHRSFRPLRRQPSRSRTDRR
ncbi:hypothetical protein AJ87_18675 [Rhizobium yanglingense]|nr:hypothetical protein AJ87_18675 [Rhizobium yanglingense]